MARWGGSWEHRSKSCCWPPLPPGSLSVLVQAQLARRPLFHLFPLPRIISPKSSHLPCLAPCYQDLRSKVSFPERPSLTSQMASSLGWETQSQGTFLLFMFPSIPTNTWASGQWGVSQRCSKLSRQLLKQCLAHRRHLVISAGRKCTVKRLL